MTAMTSRMWERSAQRVLGDDPQHPEDHENHDNGHHGGCLLSESYRFSVA